MSFLLDLIFLLIIGYAGWRGYKNGIVKGVCGIFALIISLVAANIFATVYYEEFTGMLEPFVCGVVDSAVTSTLSTDEKDVSSAIVVVDEADKGDVKTVSFAALRKIGLSEGAAEKMSAAVEKQGNFVGQEMNDTMTQLLCEKLSFLMIFSIVFVLMAIIFAVIGNVFDLKFSIPDAEKADMIGGTVIGVVFGLTVVMFMTCILRYMGFFIPEEVLGKTLITRFFMNSNIIAGIFGL